MAIAALWVLPVAFLIVFFSRKVQTLMGKRHMRLKMACADGIQECLETVRDLRANNASASYLKGLDGKIKAVEKHAIFNELTTAAFVSSAQMILKLGIATVALVGGVLLAKGSLDVLTFFLFLLLVSRLYDPMQIALQKLAAIISVDVQCECMDEILSYKTQAGTNRLDNQGYDIVFEHVGFCYEEGESVLKDAPVILLDEATASLDVDNETLIQEALSKLIQNKTVLIIAHRMRTVANADESCTVEILNSWRFRHKT